MEAEHETQEDLVLNKTDGENCQLPSITQTTSDIYQETSKQNNAIDTTITNCDLLLDSKNDIPVDELPTIGREILDIQLEEPSPQKLTAIRPKFGSLLTDVWSGEWTTLRPVPFKETLEIYHPQFRGAHQQDCQVIT